MCSHRLILHAAAASKVLGRLKSCAQTHADVGGQSTRTTTTHHKRMQSNLEHGWQGCPERAVTENNSDTQSGVHRVVGSPAVCLDSTAVGTYLRLIARICSPYPGNMRSQTASVASGVTSRGAGPVPPVVTTKQQPCVSTCWLAAVDSSIGVCGRVAQGLGFWVRCMCCWASGVWQCRLTQWHEDMAGARWGTATHAIATCLSGNIWTPSFLSDKDSPPASGCTRQGMN